MSIFRRKEMLLLAFVPVAAIWAYALSQSFGQVGSLMGSLPDAQAPEARTAAPNDAGVAPVDSRAPVDAGVAQVGADGMASRGAAGSADDFESAAAAIDDAAAGLGADAFADTGAIADTRATAVTGVALDAGVISGAGDAADFVLDEDPRQRYFDPYEYELALQAHYENQRPLNLSPAAIEAESAAAAENDRESGDPRFRAALDD